MKGHVPTPEPLAKSVVQELFKSNPPSSGDRILYPGAGTAPFATAVEDICAQNGWTLPEGVGIELDPTHLSVARDLGLDHVTFLQRDFLGEDIDTIGRFDYIVGNPPYVPIEGLDDDEKSQYKTQFDAATGRFDLYLLFFERALQLLADEGSLSFITPEKFEYVDAAAPLRRMLTNGNVQVKSIEHIDEDVFEGDITFPCVTTLTRRQSSKKATTKITLRDSTTHTTKLPTSGESWAASVRGMSMTEMETGAKLKDVTVRISPGMATGADAIFVNKREELHQGLIAEWVYPTVSGRQLTTNNGPRTDTVLVCPYTEDGNLIDEDRLGDFGKWAGLYRSDLENRSCVQKDGKNWYAWHENPPMDDLLQPKIVFKDIAKEPHFWAERRGDVIPRHSVYYLIPKEETLFDDLLEYLNSPKARSWMQANCQKATSGYLRLQTRVLEDLPIPQEWVNRHQAKL